MSQPSARKRFEVGDGGFRAGQEHGIGGGGKRLAARDHFEADAGLKAERVEIVEVGDEGEEGDGNVEGVPFEGEQPLTLSLSLWERERPLNGCERTPSPRGRGLG